MSYKGYMARIEYDDEDRLMVGHIAGISDIVGFHAETVADLHAAFEEAVDDYLATCKAAGKDPQRPYSGKFMLRLDPELHRKAAVAAELAGVSLNQWAEDAIASAVDEAEKENMREAPRSAA
nr:type II toxin-antitoxin system HicB family antitoxin [Methyloligella sp. GL2]